MNKKSIFLIISLVLSLIFVLFLSGCSDDGGTDSKNEASASEILSALEKTKNLRCQITGEFMSARNSSQGGVGFDDEIVWQENSFTGTKTPQFITSGTISTDAKTVDLSFISEDTEVHNIMGTDGEYVEVSYFKTVYELKSIPLSQNFEKQDMSVVYIIDLNKDNFSDYIKNMYNTYTTINGSTITYDIDINKEKPMEAKLLFQ